MTDLHDTPVEPSRSQHATLSHEAALRVVSHSHFTVRHNLETSCQFDPHFHTAFSVTHIISGRMTATIAGDEVVALAGQSLFTNVAEVHSAVASHVEFVSISARMELVDEVMAEMGFTPRKGEVVFRERLVLDEFIAGLARSIRRELIEDRPGREMMLKSLVHQLVIHLVRTHLSVRHSPRIELSRAGPVDRRLRRAIEFMHDNFDRDLSLEEIASSAYLSEYHFSRLFKQVTNLSPGVYLANVRIEKARQLLSDTRLPISEIASRVGYHSQSHFTKVFKSITGATPRAFRESASGSLT
jgi:AraC-like DNA-binding protein/quercetin dioxygenase-like cupin family protein